MAAGEGIVPQFSDSVSAKSRVLKAAGQLERQMKMLLSKSDQWQAFYLTSSEEEGKWAPTPCMHVFRVDQEAHHTDSLLLQDSYPKSSTERDDAKDLRV